MKKLIDIENFDELLTALKRHMICDYDTPVNRTIMFMLIQMDTRIKKLEERIEFDKFDNRKDILY